MSEMQSGGLGIEKSLNSIKETTQIRKVTQETLGPVIKKIEEQIAHLLQESQSLRRQTTVLQQIQSTNREYKLEIESLRARVSDLNKLILEKEQDSLAKHEQNKKRLAVMGNRVQDLEKKDQEKQEKISKLTELNQAQTELFSMSRQAMREGIEIVRKEVTQFYENSIKSTRRMQDSMTRLQLQSNSHTKLIESHQKQLTDINVVTSLYTSQREEIRGYLMQLVELKEKAVVKEEYDRDRRAVRMEMEGVKVNVEKVINDALTPEIRMFLPTLKDNVQLLNKMQKQIQECVQQVQQSKQAERNFEDKFLKLQYSTKKGIEQRQVQTKKLSLHVDSQITTISEQFQTNVSEIQEKIQTVEQTVTNAKSETEEKFETFIEKNSAKLYLAVLACKPLEVKEEEERIRRKLDGFEKKMEEVEQKIVEKSDGVISLGNSLDQKLELFQNRITKTKSDLKVEIDQLKKYLDSINHKLQQSENTSHQQSQMVSRLMELGMMSIALQINDEYLLTQNKYTEDSTESYISFHDGIIYEVTGDLKRNELCYRKKRMNRQIMKRTILNQQAKLIDYVTEKLKNWKWTQAKERPGQFFVEKILPSYETMMSQKASLIQARKHLDQNERSPNVSFKMISHRKSRDSFHRGASISKFEPLSSSKKMLNNTIQEHSKKEKKGEEQGRGVSLGQRISLEMGNTTPVLKEGSEIFSTMDFHKPNRIKLRKIDQKDGKDRNPRYGKNRQTIE